LSFMALPVIPEIRITPRGIYLVNEDRMLRTPFS
jgi:adenine deaminase